MNHIYPKVTTHTGELSKKNQGIFKEQNAGFSAQIHRQKSKQEEVKEDDIYLKFGQHFLERPTDRPTDRQTNR